MTRLFTVSLYRSAAVKPMVRLKVKVKVEVEVEVRITRLDWKRVPRRALSSVAITLPPISVNKRCIYNC